jgi:hypothetical protein
MKRMPLLLDVMIRPRDTMRWILDNRGTKGIVLLIILSFFSSVLKDIDWTNFKGLTESFSTAAILGIVVGGSAIGAVITVGLFYGLSWIATAAGRFFGGTGDYKAVRTALAWGTAPVILALLYRIPAVIFWPAAMSRSSSGVKVSKSIQVSATAFADIPMYQIATLMLLDAIVVLWFLIVASNTLGEAQRVSSLAGFGNLLLAFVLPIVAAIAIATAAHFAFK